MIKNMIIAILLASFSLNGSEQLSKNEMVKNFFAPQPLYYAKWIAATAAIGYAGYTLGAQARKYYDERVYIRKKIQQEACLLLQQQLQSSRFSISYNSKRYTVHLVLEKFLQGDGVKALLTRNSQIVREYFFKKNDLLNYQEQKAKKMQHTQLKPSGSISIIQGTLMNPDILCVQENEIVPKIKELALKIADDENKFMLKTSIVSNNKQYAVCIVKKQDKDKNPNVIIEHQDQTRIFLLNNLDGFIK